MVRAVAEESMGLNPKIKEGSYPVRLAGVVEKIISVPQKDSAGNPIMSGGVVLKDDIPRWNWVFGLRMKNDKGGDEDIRFEVLTSPKLTTKSKAFSFAKALNGGNAPELHKEFDTDALVGKYAMAGVKDGKPRTDRTGVIQISSVISDLFPLETPPTTEIDLSKIPVETEEEEEQEPEPEPEPTPKPVAKKKK